MRTKPRRPGQRGRVLRPGPRKHPPSEPEGRFGIHRYRPEGPKPWPDLRRDPWGFLSPGLTSKTAEAATEIQAGRPEARERFETFRCRHHRTCRATGSADDEGHRKIPSAIGLQTPLNVPDRSRGIGKNARSGERKRSNERKPKPSSRHPENPKTPQMSIRCEIPKDAAGADGSHARSGCSAFTNQTPYSNRSWSKEAAIVGNRRFRVQGNYRDGPIGQQEDSCSMKNYLVHKFLIIAQFPHKISASLSTVRDRRRRSGHSTYHISW